MPRKKKANSSTAIVAVGLAAIGALLLAKGGSQQATPAIYLNPAPVNIAFPQFTFPSNPLSGGSVVNLTNLIPDPGQGGEQQQLSLPSFPSAPNIVLPKTPVFTLPDTTNIIPQVDVQKGIFEVISGKFLPAEIAYDVTSTGFERFLGGDTSTAKKITTGSVVSTTAFETSLIGYGLSKGGFNLAKEGTKQILIDGAELAGTKAILKGGGLGIVGGTAVTVGGAIALGESVGAAADLKKTGSPTSAFVLGQGIGTLGFLGTQTAAAAGVGLPALGFGQAFLAGNVVSLAVGSGAVVGLFADTALENAGILDPNRPGILDGVLKSPSQNLNFNAVNDTRSSARPAVSDTGTAFGTPDLAAGDFEANNGQAYSGGPTTGNYVRTTTKFISQVPRVGQVSYVNNPTGQLISKSKALQLGLIH